MVERILLDEIEKNKTKAEEYLDININSHKRFINSEHPDFSMNKELKEKESGIRFKNHFNLWFQEQIPNRGEEIKLNHNRVREENVGDFVDGGLHAAAMAANVLGRPDLGAGIHGAAAVIKNVRGYTSKLQKDELTEDDDVHLNKLPSKPGNEASVHLDLCLDYMEIIDKMLVDIVPKIFIMMLVMKFLDFLNGGEYFSYLLISCYY